MNATHSGAEDAARLWAIRIGDPSFKDWEGFTAWLDEDLANLPAYEAAIAANEWAASLLAAGAARAGNDDAPIAVDEPFPPRRRGTYWASGLVAMAAAVVALVLFWPAASRRDVAWIATAPGQHRTIALEDGTRIAMNGSTRIGLSTTGPARQVELAEGEALFRVRHDAVHPFSVVAGDTRLVDVGTIFNVVHDGGALRVAVAEGEVVYRPGAGQIALRQGDSLSRADATAKPVVSRVDPPSVGAWETGSLQYDDATLDRVASDLGRSLGQPIAAGRDAAGLRFTGTLNLSGTPRQVLARAGPLLGVTFAPAGGGWTMRRADDAQR